MKRYIAQEKARVESLRRAAQTTVQPTVENLLRFTPGRVFLSAAEYLGQEGPIAYNQGFPEGSHTTIELLKKDLLQPATGTGAAEGGSAVGAAALGPVPVGGYKLVLLDPPYGVTSEKWDARMWTGDNIVQVMKQVMSVNTCEAFTLVSFCSAQQLSPFLEAVKGLDKFLDFDVSVSHGVWHKLDHFTQGI